MPQRKWFTLIFDKVVEFCFLLYLANWKETKQIKKKKKQNTNSTWSLLYDCVCYYTYEFYKKIGEIARKRFNLSTKLPCFDLLFSYSKTLSFTLLFIYFIFSRYDSVKFGALDDRPICL